jgi:hypothetical protein
MLWQPLIVHEVGFHIVHELYCVHSFPTMNFAPFDTLSLVIPHKLNLILDMCMVLVWQEPTH